MIYIVKWAVALTLLYSLYGLTLRRETLHTLNRAVLVAILLASAVLPLCHFHLGHETWLSEGFARLEQELSLPGGQRLGDEASLTGRSGEDTRLRQSFLHDGMIIPSSPNDYSIMMEQSKGVGENGKILGWLMLIYCIGAALYLLAYLRSLLGIVRLIRRSELIEVRDGARILLCTELKNACSWMQWIMVERGEGDEAVLTHELTHVRLGHSWDKMLAEITCRTLWFLPFAWMLREDLSDVHEYEADRAVLQTGIDIREYNQLLILKAVRPGLQPVVNTFNQSRIKKRITMMFKRKSNKWCAAKALYLLPMTMLAIVAFAKPSDQVPSRSAVPTEETVGDESTYRLDFSKPVGHVKEMVALDHAVLRIDGEPATPVNGNWLNDIDLNNVTITKDAEGNITRVDLSSKADNDSIYDVVEVNAGFPGGDAACYEWMRQNIHYPAEAVAKKIQGRVLVQFVVEKDGRITQAKVMKSPDKLLSDEALRVVKLMPAWTPAKVGNRIVCSHFFLPIIFKLPQGERNRQ